MRGVYDPVTIGARRTLLDVLDLLGPHRSSVVLVGAQAIYLHIGESDLPVALFTKDVDLALDPGRLAAEPKITPLLESHSFTVHSDWPGNWSRREGSDRIDFIVPAAVVQTGRRSAHLPTQGNKLANFAHGLEGALIDNEVKLIVALEAHDPRHFEIAVAGPAALLVAKLWKLGEREDKGGERLVPKDALDVLFILRTISVHDLVRGFRRQQSDKVAAPSVAGGLAYLQNLFGDESSVGSSLAAQALSNLEDEMSVRRSCSFLAQELLQELIKGS
jgi:Nucleotidyltransferase